MPLANVNTAWKQDLYVLVNRTFDYEQDTRMNKFMEIMGKENINSVDFRDAGTSGYGELPDYTGALASLNQARGFITIYTPAEKAGAIDISF